MMNLVNIFKYIEASKIVLRFSRLLKERSLQMVDAQNTGDYKHVQDLRPYFEGIVWSADKLNLNIIKEFQIMCVEYFGIKNYGKMCKFELMENNIRACFATIEPTTFEIQDYMDKFLDRYKLELKGYHRNNNGGQNPYNNNGNNDNNGGGGQQDTLMGEID